MDIFNNVKLDKSSNVPLYQQLAESILNLIEQRELAPDTKLPPIRSLAASLGVNSVTVVNAYKYLESKKAVYSHVGSGTFVADPGLNDNKPVTRSLLSRKKLDSIDTEHCINFADTSVSVELFPVSQFKNCFNAVLDRDKGDAFSYSDIDAMGYKPLRRVIAQRLEEEGIKAFAERIQIISGAQQGLDIVSKAMLNTGDMVFTEKPTCYGALGAIFSRGAQAVEIPLEYDGINIDILKKLLKVYNPKFTYVMTRYQTPTGICYSPQKKRELLELAYKHNFYIIEEDNMGDFNYTDVKPVTLKALDYRNRVIYIKSFSKILMPGLRIGYMILPKAVSQAVTSAKYSSDISTSGFIQRAFELYLQSSEHNSHINRMCSIFSEKYKLITSLTDEKLMSYFSYNKTGGGLTLWLKLSDKLPDTRVLCSVLTENGVVVMPGNLFTSDDEEIKRHIRLSFANVTNDNIKDGISIIEDVCKQLYTKCKL